MNFPLAHVLLGHCRIYVIFRIICGVKASPVDCHWLFSWASRATGPILLAHNNTLEKQLPEVWPKTPPLHLALLMLLKKTLYVTG